MKRFFVTAFFVTFAIPVISLAYKNPGNPSGFVNDFAKVLTVEQKNVLEQKLSAFEQQTSNEISIVTIPTLDEDTIENYAVALFKDWGIGKKKNDNGVLLLVAIGDHKMRIEVGYGLEGALTDAISSDIIRNTLTPAFKNNDFYGGIDKAVDSMISATKNEYLSTNQSNNQTSNDIGGILVIAFFTIHILMWVASVLARSKSWWAGGVVGAVMSIFIGIFLGLFAFGVALVLFIPFGLLFDFLVSRIYGARKINGLPIPWFIGGGRRGGGRGGFGGFGGFGGGGSGGGGSSGGW
ncbi:MAG: TPM domain-containing protein [Patescibacteria group bacterium]|nr:TPM domain-containing protein [Patescibacteria group bacterium]